MKRALLVITLLAATIPPPLSAQSYNRRLPPASPEEIAEADARLAAFVAPRLTRFASDEEFDAYLDALAAARNIRRERSWAQAEGPVRPASLRTGAQEPECSPEDPLCANGGLPDEASIVTTGARMTPRNPSITNNQMANVDEGDIVKQIGQFLVILQDGRLFVVDMEGGSGRDLVLTDRRNVYRSTTDTDWYDEMLVRGDRIVVTAYSNQQRATEISVFRLDERGRVNPEGVFYLSSNDYYSGGNYATRLVGDNLVVYTTLSLALVRRGARSRPAWPAIRRWVDAEGRATEAQGRPLYDAQGIYRPVIGSSDPAIHTVSVCPLDSSGQGRNLDCRSTAIAASSAATYYVSDTDAYLWVAPSRFEADWSDADCETVRRGPPAPAIVYRMPHDGGAPTIASASGIPVDQFSLEVSRGQFRAIAFQPPAQCRIYWNRLSPLAYFSIPLTRFQDSLRPLEPGAAVGLPSVGSAHIANRFAENYLVYGALARRRPWRGVGGPARYDGARAFAVPLDRPSAPVRLNVPHSVIRAERFGDDIVLTGYADRSGLNISMVDLGRRPEVAETLILSGRYESEGRSHAFNSLTDTDGSGMFGLPTVGRTADADLSYWRSNPSDLSYISVGRSGQLRDIGRLDATVRPERQDGREDPGGNPDYECEVSCIDWYGNSRPIFTDGRIFGLTGTEVIEGERRGGGPVRELRRLDITQPPGTGSRNTSR